MLEIFTGPEQLMVSGALVTGVGAGEPSIGAVVVELAGAPTVPELEAVKVELAVWAPAGPAAARRHPRRSERAI